MREIVVPLGDRSYSIRIGAGLLAQLGELARAAGMGGTAALVQDSNVAALYGASAAASLEAAGFRVVPVTVPAGESSKSLEQLSRLYEAFAAAALDRRAFVVALGGGVVGDLAGFAAASYLRGLAFVQVPTTLLAQVDSSVGGKTGIDLPAGKNLVGAFHQPALVLADLDTLRTLPDSEYRSGLAEVIKYGIIVDAELFGFLEAQRDRVLGRDPDALAHLVARSCEIKAQVVGADERESGLREILNYGHTIGHAVEAAAGYGEYLHGEAIAVGMAAAGRIGTALGWLDPVAAARIEALLAAYGLPTRLRAPLPPEALLEAMRRDKKARAGDPRFVLARALGHVETVPVPVPEVTRVLEAIQPH